MPIKFWVVVAVVVLIVVEFFAFTNLIPLHG